MVTQIGAQLPAATVTVPVAGEKLVGPATVQPGPAGSSAAYLHSRDKSSERYGAANESRGAEATRAPGAESAGRAPPESLSSFLVFLSVLIHHTRA